MMITHPISETRLHVSITGTTGTKITNIDETLRQLDQIKDDLIYQLFDADKIAGWRHIYFATVNANKALETGHNISKKLDIETLLYTSCHDQISKAFKAVGVTPETSQTAIITIGEDPEKTKEMAERIAENLGEQDDSVLAVDDNKYNYLLKVFELSEKAIKTLEKDKHEALTDLIIEKGALLALRR